jgi:hypothetical protein
MIYTFLEMKILLYWSESNSWIYFDIVIKKTEKLDYLFLYIVDQNRTDGTIVSYFIIILYTK